MTWQRCAVCNHVERIAIETAIREGVPHRVISEKFLGFPHDAVGKHRDECMTIGAVVIQNDAEVMHVEMDPAAVYQETDDVARAAQELIEYCKGAKDEYGTQTRPPDTRGWALGIREWRGCCEQKAKMMGMYDQVDPRLQTNHLQKMVDVLAKVLEPLPEAKQKVLEALEQLKQNG